eukprot:3168125-Alexandrium_andersonii.AAC.1
MTLDTATRDHRFISPRKVFVPFRTGLSQGGCRSPPPFCKGMAQEGMLYKGPVSYTHLRAHETSAHL